MLEKYATETIMNLLTFFFNSPFSDSSTTIKVLYSVAGGTVAFWLGCSTPGRAVWVRVLAGDIREFKQIATAGADTAAGSKFPQK